MKATEFRTIQGEQNRLESLPRGHSHWKWADKPSVLTMHKRIHRKCGPAKNYLCKHNCGRMAIDWALIGQEYTDNPVDYIPLCRSCHMIMDDHPSHVDRSAHKIIRDKKGRIITTLVINTDEV